MIFAEGRHIPADFPSYGVNEVGRKGGPAAEDARIIELFLRRDEDAIRQASARAQKERTSAAAPTFFLFCPGPPYSVSMPSRFLARMPMKKEMAATDREIAAISMKWRRKGSDRATEI